MSDLSFQTFVVFLSHYEGMHLPCVMDLITILVWFNVTLSSFLCASLKLISYHYSIFPVYPLFGFFGLFCL